VLTPRHGAGTTSHAGCLLYIVGALCFRRGLPDPAPAVFGYHEVFHACVCAAATCHYIAIALLTL
jgi:hemolysin III